MRLAISIILSLFPLYSAFAGQTYEHTKIGTKCETDSLRQFTCDYKIGKNLHVTIAAIGKEETAVTIFKSDWDGDYYASFGIMHQCVVIKPGATAKDKLDIAFISPKNGKVYSDWQSCKNGE